MASDRKVQFQAKQLKSLLERVKRSGSEFPFEFSHADQCLRTPADFCVGRFVGRFIRRFLSAYWILLSAPSTNWKFQEVLEKLSRADLMPYSLRHLTVDCLTPRCVAGRGAAAPFLCLIACPEFRRSCASPPATAPSRWARRSRKSAARPIRCSSRSDA